MSKIKACLFDLDGTLLYTLEAIASAGNRMLKELGYPPEEVDAYRYYCGDGADVLVERCLKKAGAFTEENYRTGCILNRRFLSEDPLKGVRPYDGMTEVLAELKKRSIMLAVVSNKPDGAAKETIHHAFGALFDHVEGQREGIPRKPDPAIALEAAAALKVKPGECLYIGDTGTDMLTGRRAGMVTVGVLWGYRDAEELIQNGASRLIRESGEIIGILEEPEE